MKLIAFYLLVVCERFVFPAYVQGGTRITESCQQAKYYQYCGSNSYCPYPDQMLYNNNAGCCCLNVAPHFEIKMTPITAICGTGIATQACEDYPYCPNTVDYNLIRTYDRCCCANLAQANALLKAHYSQFSPATWP